MKALLLSLLALPALAGGWVSIQPDHFNLLYSEGERAKFVITALSQPTDPDFSLAQSVTPEGEAEESLEFVGGETTYQTAPLVAGQKSFTFTTKLFGPGGFERVVEESQFDLTIQPVSESE